MKLLATKEKILKTNTGKILYRKDSSNKQHTLTFSGIGTVTVNGKTVTSGYLLEAGDVIVATPLLASGKPDKIGPNSVSVNGTWYDCPNTVSVNAGDVELILLAATADPNDGGGESLTINYTGFMPG